MINHEVRSFTLEKRLLDKLDKASIILHKNRSQIVEKLILEMNLEKEVESFVKSISI